MKEMLKQKIENWKNLPQPSSSASACLEYEELESSKLLPPQLLTSIKRQDLFSLFWEIEKMIEEEGVHISVIANQSSRAGNTMLHIAAMYERQDILEVICEHFPHLMKKQNIKGDTVVHIIGRNAGKKNVMMRSVIEWYERHLEDDEEDNKVWRMENIHGNTALHEAVMACNVEGVKMLYREDGGVTHLMNKEGKSALYLGVETGNYDIINVLMEAPFFNRRIHQGTSPLHAAIFARSSGEITKYSVSQPLVKSWLVDTVKEQAERGEFGEDPSK
ncbi:protein ACCELERATED CELL DEATH 6-like [Senna tora]|uniref:Protein ACCELERATED CELL DEATH 6-like n=1 Tax=Senna tora TaxID=362788 RepID=A0A834TJX3_9FABA|nr:protein ACCELERATED CELL DEATH 6-like [Senna tora]